MVQKSRNTNLPRIRIKWIRGADLPSANLDFKKPLTSVILGPKDSGKSAWCETIGTRFTDTKVIDLFGSRDNEGLGWCRFREVASNEILFVHGDSTEVSGKWDALKSKEVTLGDLTDYRVITSVSAFYGNLDEEFIGLNRIIYDALYKRTHWRRPWNLTVREGANFLYSRIKIVKNQTLAKNDFIYLLRESRHMGLFVNVDTIKWTSVDLDIRHVSDYIIIKRVGIYGLPKDLRFVYRYIDPPSLMDPPPYAFIVVCARGPIGMGRFDLPYFHKLEHENLIEELGIKIDYGDIPDYGDPNRNTVGDPEHAMIVKDYFEGGSMQKTGLRFKRSPATVNKHVKEHDHAVNTLGYCSKCQAVQGPFTKIRVSKKDRGKVVQEHTSWEAFEKTF